MEHRKNFLKNDLPEEIIVVKDSPSQIPNSVETKPIQTTPDGIKELWFKATSEKPEREDVYHLLYHVEPGPGARPNHYTHENSKSRFSDDGTTFAEQTTATDQGHTWQMMCSQGKRGRELLEDSTFGEEERMRRAVVLP